MPLAAALALADHASPSPAEARAGLQVLRQALADALAMSVDELQQQSVGYTPDRI
jgi:hypothetical protein